MLADNVNIGKGYINVSFNGSPVVKIEEVKEESNEEEGIIEEVIGDDITSEDALESDMDVDIEPME